MPFYSMEFSGAVPNEAIDGGIYKPENILTAVLDIEDDDDEEYWD